MLKHIYYTLVDKNKALVRSATCNDFRPVSIEQLKQLILSDEYRKVANHIWERLQDYEHFMHVRKALQLVSLLFDTALENNNDLFPQYCIANINAITTLTRYKFYDYNDNDIAHIVRHDARNMIIKLQSYEEQQEGKLNAISIEKEINNIGEKDELKKQGEN